MQKEKKLEEFRSYRTSKRREQERKKEATNEKALKLRIVFCVKKTQMINQTTKFAIETEEKTFS